MTHKNCTGILSEFCAQCGLFQEECGAVRSTKWALESEKIHAEMYTAAKVSVTDGKDAEIGIMHVCSVCGWTGEGDAPDNCPLCNAKTTPTSLN